MARDARVFSARPGDIRKDGRGVARLGRCAASGGSAFDDASRRVFSEANMSGDEFGDDPGMSGEDSTDQVPLSLPALVLTARAGEAGERVQGDAD